MAIYVHGAQPSNKKSITDKCKVQHFDLRSNNIDKLRYNIAMYDWSLLFASTDIQFIYSFLLDAINSSIAHCMQVVVLLLFVLVILIL